MIIQYFNFNIGTRNKPAPIYHSIRQITVRIFLCLLFNFYFPFNEMCESSRAHTSLVTANVHRDWWTDVEYVMPTFTLRYPKRSMVILLRTNEVHTYFVLLYPLALAVHLIHINYIDSSVSHNRHTTFWWWHQFWHSIVEVVCVYSKHMNWNSVNKYSSEIHLRIFFHSFISFMESDVKCRQINHTNNLSI